MIYLLIFTAIVFLFVLGVNFLKNCIRSKKGQLKGRAIVSFNWFEIIIGTVLTIYSMLLLCLFAWAVFSSFKTAEAFEFLPWPFPVEMFKDFPNNLLPVLERNFAPENFTLDNYTAVFESIKVSSTTGNGSYNIWDQFGNAVIYSVGSAFFRVAATTIVAYCTAKYKHWLSTLIYNVVLITIALPIVGNMASMLQIMQDLRIYDTFWGMFIMNFAFNNIYFLIIHAAFKSAPWTYAEAAFIDGASHFRVFWKIYLPMVLNLVGAVFILFFIEIWNEYQTPLVYLPSYPTISYGLWYVANNSGKLVMPDGSMAGPPLIIAAGVFSFSIIFVVFMIFKDKLMGNLSEGGIKG